VSFRDSEKPDFKRVGYAGMVDTDHARRMVRVLDGADLGEGADLKPIKEIVHRAFRNTYQKEVKDLPLGIERSALSSAQPRTGENITQVDPEGVSRVARDMESLIAMSDGVADDQMITIQATLADFRSFVCYMRELDLSYRSILNLAAEQVEKAKKKRDKPGLILPKGVE
jgi:hypothetical protein